MPTLNLDSPTILGFLLVLARLSAFFATWPVFGLGNVPAPVKVLFSLSFALMVYGVIPMAPFEEKDFLTLLALGVVVGLTFGFLMRAFFFALMVMGDMISMSLGLANAQMLNPIGGERSTTVETLKMTMGMLFFLSISGHYLMLEGIMESFELVPLTGLSLNAGIFEQLPALIQNVIMIGLKLSAPLVIAIFLLNLSMGILGRTVPQINILISSIPVNILVGLVILILCLPILFDQWTEDFVSLTDGAFRILREM